MKPTVRNLSVFFPVFNEAAALPGLIEAARADLVTLGIDDYELIIVDDGSSDGSGAIADRLAKQFKEVRVVHHERNLGYGAALVTGFAAAVKDWVMYTDGDGQFRLEDLSQFMGPAQNHDVVLGYRKRREDHFGRKLNAALWGWLVRSILRLNVQDVDCGFKLIRREALLKALPLQSTGAVISAELLVKLKRLGYSLAEVGVNHYPRRGGRPTGASVSVIIRALRELVTLKRRLDQPETPAAL